MQLNTITTRKYTIDSTQITQVDTERKEVTPIAKSVKITGKAKQRCQDKRENLESTFFKIAAIDRAKNKKQNFFNKHKSNK